MPRYRLYKTLLSLTLLLAVPGPGLALELALPDGATVTGERAPIERQHLIARGPWSDGSLAAIPAEGVVQEMTWSIPEFEMTTSALLAEFEEQLSDQGYRTIFTCADRACGGFDFRHALPLGQPPRMHIDLGNFQYLSARLTNDQGTSYVAITVSRGGARGFVHTAIVQPASAANLPVTQSSRSLEPDASDIGFFPAASSLAEQLLAVGHAPLDDLQFDIGASRLSGDAYVSLTELAVFLGENPNRDVVLVGHTDAVGSLSGNIELSEARASAVRRFLVERLDVNPNQVAAAGIGFLAPRATNQTEVGREANRRVEVVLSDPG